MFEEFTEPEIFNHVWLNPHPLQVGDEYQAEVELTYLIEKVVKKLTPAQQKATLRMIQSSIETRLKHLP